MDGDEVGGAEQVLLGGGEFDTDLVGALPGEVLAPATHPHAEGEPDLRHPAADLPEAQQAEPAAVQVGSHRLLPGAALPQRVALLDDAAGQAQQQGPGQFDGWRRRGGRTAHGDAVRLGGGVVDDAVAHAGGDDQFQPGQSGDQ